MAVPPPTPLHDDRHGRVLAELAAMGMEIARDLRERALNAETPEEATRLARAFHTVSRGVRQSLALELKVIAFRNDLHRALREEAAKAAEAREPAVARRREAIGRQVERLIYTEHEGYEFIDDEAERLQGALSDWMATASERDDFTTADLDGQILDACRALGLDPARFAILDAAEADEDDEGYGDEDDPDPAAADRVREPATADSS